MHQNRFSRSADDNVSFLLLFSSLRRMHFSFVHFSSPTKLKFSVSTKRPCSEDVTKSSNNEGLTSLEKSKSDSKLNQVTAFVTHVGEAGKFQLRFLPIFRPHTMTNQSVDQIPITTSSKEVRRKRRNPNLIRNYWNWTKMSVHGNG